MREGDQFVPQSSAIIYFQTLDPQTFSAYYPYDANGGTLSVTTGTEAQQDQSAIDFLYATGAEGNASSPEVKFINENAAGETDFTKDHSFHHCMSQITLTFEGGKGVNFDAGKLTDYTLGGLKLEGTFNTDDGIAAVNEEALPDVLSMELDNVDASSVILFPQEVETLSLEVIYNNQLYDATLTVPEGALMAGTNYKYRVFINNREMNVGQADISKWNEVACDDVHAEMEDE